MAADSPNIKPELTSRLSSTGVLAKDTSALQQSELTLRTSTSDTRNSSAEQHTDQSNVNSLDINSPEQTPRLSSRRSNSITTDLSTTQSSTTPQSARVPAPEYVLRPPDAGVRTVFTIDYSIRKTKCFGCKKFIHPGKLRIIMKPHEGLLRRYYHAGCYFNKDGWWRQGLPQARKSFLEGFHKLQPKDMEWILVKTEEVAEQCQVPFAERRRDMIHMAGGALDHLANDQS